MTVALPDRQLFDLAGPTPEDKYRKVRVVGPDAQGGYALYGEAASYPDGIPTHTEGVVLLRAVAGPLEQVKARRWTLGPYTVTIAAGCGCGGRGAVLRSFVP